MVAGFCGECVFFFSSRFSQNGNKTNKKKTKTTNNKNKIGAVREILACFAQATRVRRTDAEGKTTSWHFSLTNIALAVPFFCYL